MGGDNFFSVGSFSFQEPDTGEECWASVRVGQKQIAVVLSRKPDGDVEVALSKPDAEQLLTLLAKAIADC
jgi:hypothetical protein